MKSIIALVLLVLVSSDQYVPIPSKPYGFSLGATDGQFHLEAFLDLQCPDSKQSFNALMAVMKTIDFQAKSIKFTFQHVPLPYHFYSFKLHQALIYVQSHGSQTNTLNFINYLYTNQDNFTEEKMQKYTVTQVLDELSTMVATVAKVDQKDLRTEMDAFSSTDLLTRYHWKYCMEVHGIAGTPTFAANSVIVDGAETFGFNDWIDFFKKYT